MDHYRITGKAVEYRPIGHRNIGRPKRWWEDDVWRILCDRNRSYGLPCCCWWWWWIIKNKYQNAFDQQWVSDCACRELHLYIYSYKSSSGSIVSGRDSLQVKGPPVPIVQEAGWASEPVWTQRLEEKSFYIYRGSNLDRPIVQPVTRVAIVESVILTYLTTLFCNSGFTT
jgi:hypothetical protein